MENPAFRAKICKFFVIYAPINWIGEISCTLPGGMAQQVVRAGGQALIFFLERKSIKKNFNAFVKTFWPKGFCSVTEVLF